MGLVVHLGRKILPDDRKIKKVTVFLSLLLTREELQNCWACQSCQQELVKQQLL
jgi:hypothetical protein